MLQHSESYRQPLEILEELAEKVINNRFHDMGGAYYVAFSEVINALVYTGAFKTTEELDKAYEMKDQLAQLLLDEA